MQFTLATLAALAAASIVSAATSAGAPPAGCSTSYSGSFEITVSLPMKKRALEEVSAGEYLPVGAQRLTEDSVKPHAAPELSLPPSAIVSSPIPKDALVASSPIISSNSTALHLRREPSSTVAGRSAPMALLLLVRPPSSTNASREPSTTSTTHLPAPHVRPSSLQSSLAVVLVEQAKAAMGSQLWRLLSRRRLRAKFKPHRPAKLPRSPMAKSKLLRL